MYSTFNERRVLITGGIGFIGSNLARRLVEFGAEVTLVDSLIPEYGGRLFNISGIEDKVLVNISDVRDEHSMHYLCLLYTSPSPRDRTRSRMPSSA